MARTPGNRERQAERKQITAFIVEADWPGVEVVHRCHFMGLRGDRERRDPLHQRAVPKENVLWGEGKGLKLALITLNTGRLTLPASVRGGAASAACSISRAVGGRARAVGPADRQARRDRAEARHDGGRHLRAWRRSRTCARCWPTAAATTSGSRRRSPSCGTPRWAGRSCDDTLQIRGGRGYETADSLRARGEAADPGRAHDARLAHQPDLRGLERDHAPVHRARGGRPPPQGGRRRWSIPARRWAGKAGALLQAARVLRGAGIRARWLRLGPLAALRRVRRARGAPALRRAHEPAAGAHALPRDGALRPKLEQRQTVLFRLVDIGAELFAMAAACARAEMLRKTGAAGGGGAGRPVLPPGAPARARTLPTRCSTTTTCGPIGVAQQVLGGKHSWLEAGVVDMRA